MTTRTAIGEIRELLMQAYVLGWQDGREGKTNDDGKHDAADALVATLPASIYGGETCEVCGRLSVVLHKADVAVFDGLDSIMVCPTCRDKGVSWIFPSNK